MKNTTRVTEEEFNAAMAKLNAVPDGFKINGGMVQTHFYVEAKEVGRYSQDGFGPIWELVNQS